MKIQYVCHACIYVETSDATIAIDPWFNGPAYQNQWHVFPKPVETEHVKQAGFILVTHGHEDHLHAPTLRLFNKSARVFYPYQWKKGIGNFLSQLGFSNYTEAISFQTHQITAETSITFVSNNLDSIVVIENKGKVLMNLNDALNAHHKNVIKTFASALKKRWPKIDLLFCGLGGAGYFPNCVHHKGKNDEEVGRLREQFLAHTFCKLLKELEPETVLPFVPGFALLADDKRWINGVKFARELLPGYYRDHFNPQSQTKFANMYPGDWFAYGTHHTTSPYHALEIGNDVSHLVEEQYATEIELYNTSTSVAAEAVKALFEAVTQNLPHAARVFPKQVYTHIHFTLQITDAAPEAPSFLNIRFDGKKFVTETTGSPHAGSWLLIRTKAHILEYALASEWGGDVFMVGYGADIDILNDRALQENHDIISLRLLTRIPIASDYLTLDPLCMARFIMNNTLFTRMAAKQKLLTRGNPNKVPHNERSHWINKTQCEICMACDLPLLSYAFGESLDEKQVDNVK